MKKNKWLVIMICIVFIIGLSTVISEITGFPCFIPGEKAIEISKSEVSVQELLSYSPEATPKVYTVGKLWRVEWWSQNRPLPYPNIEVLVDCRTGRIHTAAKPKAVIRKNY